MTCGFCMTASALLGDQNNAAPVKTNLQTHGLQLESILVTHDHSDQTAGIDVRREATTPRADAPTGSSLRAQSNPTLPTSAQQKLEINPFLRAFQPAITAAAHCSMSVQNDVAVCVAIAQWNNDLK